jgi:probable HAF family extracellular repeat protein
MKTFFRGVLGNMTVAASMIATAGLASSASAQHFPFTDSCGVMAGAGDWTPTEIISPMYQLDEVPTLGGVESYATSISNNGWIVGGAKLASGVTQAVRFRVGGVIQNLGSLPGLAYSSAYSVNDSGDVVGVSCSSASLFGSSAQPWVFRAGQLVDLDPLNRGVYAAACGINNAGVVAGTLSFLGTGSVESFKWTSGAPENLPDLPGDVCRISYGMGINGRGSVVGYSAAPGACGVNRPVVYPASGGAFDLGTLGGVNGQAQALNGFGDIVGVSELSTGQNHATMWTSSGPQDLGTLGGASFAMGINDEGIICGYFIDARNQQRACVWIAGQMYDLNALMGNGSAGWRLLIATGVNAQGQIVGQGRNAAGRLRGFVLTPPCRSDYNQDGGIDGNDVASFFDAWSAGLPDTDLNLDGGVDANDAAFFLELWAAGRC